jgi:hypothetical protein
MSNSLSLRLIVAAAWLDHSVRVVVCGCGGQLKGSILSTCFFIIITRGSWSSQPAGSFIV